jgi:hypothetical protein
MSKAKRRLCPNENLNVTRKSRIAIPGHAVATPSKSSTATYPQGVPMPMLKTLAVASIVCAAAFAANAADQDFTLYNATGYTIDKVFVSDVGKKTWGGDIMGNGNLEDGSKVDITFKSGTTNCNFDLKVVYDDDDTATWSDVNLCELSKIHLHWDKKAGVTRASGE